MAACDRGDTRAEEGGASRSLAQASEAKQENMYKTTLVARPVTDDRIE